jgi:shikimate kinase
MLIFLIGFMGCGKSYTAKDLSAHINVPMVDMDKFIVNQENMTIREIFEKKGEGAFREMEREYLEKLNPEDDLIIATGGGAPCFFDNMQLMKQKGLTIYLNRNREKALAQLLKGQHKRPLLDGMTPEQVGAFYDERLEERRKFYEQAEIWAGDKDYREIATFIEQYKATK